MTRKLRQSLIQQKRATEQVNLQIPGLLGIPLDGQKRTEVPNRNAFVFVRLRSNQSEVIQAYNNKVAPAYDLPVLVERSGGRYEVVGVDTQRYENNWNSYAPFLPRHGNTHSFNPETGGGGDIVWVYPDQFMPALVFPSGSVGAANLVMSPYTLQNSNGTWKYVGSTGTANIAQHRPSSPTGAIMALVYLDAPSGNPYLIVNSGTVFLNSITGSSQVYPYIPQVTDPTTQIPLTAVRLITGTSKLTWGNLYDVRQWLHTTPTGSSGGGSGIDTIGVAGEDEGVPVGTGTVLNVTGANATLTRSGTVLNLDITSSPGAAGLGVMVQDEGINVGTGTILNFVGAGVDASISGSVVRVFVTGSTGGSGINFQDEGSALGSISTLNVIGQIASGTISGSVGQISLYSDNGFQGFGYNYRISSSSTVTSGTVSLLTMNGDTPSPTNKIVARIGNTRIEITSALSFMFGSGVNWFNAGSSELADKNINYFVYLINETGASAGIKLGISRIPYARTMNDFVNTTTNEKYILGNWVNFNTSDQVENIGRITGAISTPATYYLAFNAGEDISKPIYETDWLDWQPVYSAGGSMTYTSVTTNAARYKILWRTLHFFMKATGTTGGTAATKIVATLPFDAVYDTIFPALTAYVRDTAAIAGYASINSTTPNSIDAQKYDVSNYGLGTNRIMNVGGFFEI